MVAPGGGQMDATAAGQPVDRPTAPGDLSGDEARKAFPRQVEAAIGYAASNKYDYGPRIRNLELEYTVTSALPMSDDITRVVLAYRPAGKFRGAAGSEYLDVDRQGVVQARRQINVAKESMPWVLVGLATLSIVAALVLVPVMLIMEPKGDPLFVAGRTLWVRSGLPKVQPYVTYDAVDSEGAPRKWIIVPEGEGTAIAWVNITLINQISGSVTLAIDTDAVEMITEDGITVRPIDIFERVQWPAEGSTVDSRLNVLDIPLWGNRVLESGQQISGFMAFEVPVGSKFVSLRWAATDVANIRY